MADIMGEEGDVGNWRVPLLDHEPIGVEPLAGMARGIFGEQNPDEILSPSRPVSITRVDDRYQIVFQLPNADKSDLDIARKDAELILTAGGHTRVFSLPDTLVSREIAGAEFADGAQTITFDEGGDGEDGS